MDIRSRFPLLTNQPDLVYLDSASTTQKPEAVLEALQTYYTTANANVHRGLYPLAERATEMYEAVRPRVQRFLNAGFVEEIIFTSGATDSLNRVAQGWGAQFLKSGDEILITLLEHHSNLVPWQLVAERTGAILKFVPITAEGLLDEAAFDQLLTDRTKIVSVTGLSNTLGTVVDLERLVKAAHAVGAKVCVDAAQLAAHFPIDVQALDVDFLAFSSHKLYGPTGVGVLYAKRAILETMNPWLGGGDMIKEVHTTHSTWNDLPWKFEAGTPNIADVVAFGAAIDFIQEIGFDFIQAHDQQLQAHAFKRLGELSFVTILGPQTLTEHRAVISFLVKDVHPHDVAAILGQENICVRAGHHCTMTLMKALDTVSTTRVSFGIYNTVEDVDRLVEGLRRVATVFKL